MRLTWLGKGRRGKALRRITGGALLATGLAIPMVGLTATSAYAVTCPSGTAQGGSSNVCVPIYPGQSGSYPASTDTYPFWLTQGTTGSNDNQSASNVDRSAGSDTTLFMMEALGNLYNNAGLYGCGLTSTNADCENDEGTSVESDSATTDTVDNFDRTEILNGINDIGSGNGLKQLCGTLGTPDAVTFARSSKPAVGAVSGCSIAQIGYAKDGVDAVDFQELSPGLFGSPSYYDNGTNLESGILNGAAWPSASSGEIGAPAAGWLPGNVDNCVPAGSGLSGTACAGTPFTDVDNTPIIPGDDTSSLAFRLWCQPLGNTSGTTEGTDPRILDWGELTNLTTGGATLSSALSTSGAITSLPVNALPQAILAPVGAATSSTPTNIVVTSGGNTETFEVDPASAGATSLTLVTSTTPTYAFPAGSAITYAVGDGTAIGVPIHVVGINTNSGTVATFSSFANSLSGLSGANSCESSSDMDTNASQGPDPITPVGTSSNYEIAVENNASQIATFAAADFPNDLADQAVAAATSLYAESNGVYLSNPNAGLATLQPGTSTAPSGVPLTYSESEMTLNGVSDTLAHQVTNAFPTSRTLFNGYLTTNLNATVGGFFNWLCDSDSYFQKETDLTTGQNYNNEINNIITTTYEFTRLTDTRTEVANTTPADGVSGGAPNAQCDASLASMVATGTNTLEYEPGTTPTPTNIPSPAGFAVGQVIDSTTSGFPTATVSSISGNTMTITITSGSLTSGDSYNLYFPGMPPILAVTNPNN